MTETDDLTDNVLRMMGLDPVMLASPEGRRKFGDSYGRAQADLRKAVEMGGDPSTARLAEDGALEMRITDAPPVA
jgi:hypothetical protein